MKSLVNKNKRVRGFSHGRVNGGVTDCSFLGLWPANDLHCLIGDHCGANPWDNTNLHLAFPFPSNPCDICSQFPQTALTRHGDRPLFFLTSMSDSLVGASEDISAEKT